MISSIFNAPNLVFGLVAIATYTLLVRVNPYRARVRSRVNQIKTSDASIAENTATTDNFLARLVGELQELNPSHGVARSKLQQRLAQAGIYNPVAIPRYFLAKFLLSVLLASAVIPLHAAGYLFLNSTVLAAIVLGYVGALLPSLWLDRSIARQHLLLQRSLPDFIDLMTVCLGGGLSLQQTIRQVGDELRLAHPSLASELGIIQRDMELGATVDQALRRFATRTGYEGARTLSTFIREAQRFGTDIVDALRSHADMLRSQREQAAEEKAQKASVKILIPTLLLIFPAIFVILVGPAAIQIQAAFADK